MDENKETTFSPWNLSTAVQLYKMTFPGREGGVERGATQPLDIYNMFRYPYLYIRVPFMILVPNI